MSRARERPGTDRAADPDVLAAALADVCTSWEPERLHELIASLDGRPAAGSFLDVLDAIGADDRKRFGTGDVSAHDWQVARTRAAELDRARLAAMVDRLGARVTWAGADDYPESAMADADPFPGILMALGDLRVLAGAPRVAIVGTRTPTTAGAQFAFALGRDLARAGVAVVSGLARGIDGAAHRGALTVADAPVVGIVGSGLDVVYPHEHGELWHAVSARGVLLSESRLGARPLQHQFTRRNRLLASVAHVVVVVESAARGGSLSTAHHAEIRGRSLLAVPGGPWSSVSAGTNRLLRDGRAVQCLGTADVLAAVRRATERQLALPADLSDGRPEPGLVAARVLRALGWEVQTADHVAQRAVLPVAVARTVLSGLERDGWVRRAPHGWFQLAGNRPA